MENTNAALDLPTYELFADDVSMWKNRRRPTQSDIDRAATYANERGWNGVTLDLYCDGVWRGFMKPSEEVLA